MPSRPYSELRARMSPVDRAENDAAIHEELRQSALVEMRRARNLTQQTVAAELGIDQGAVSRIEKRADMYLSTLRGYVEAVGGRLEVRAVFPGETLELRLGGGD